ncbi:hypothetical protein HDA32_003846 [Spinactinospora alkalitolerans]|uniref:DUF308 domain-containing protein n=1 Tax=Spinactinospora alkalitolerans TaxID=687207 RepID=A0A852TW42_9ACTN|nr:hypothetical protein [Spinactinospora alkalitolerans]NYE48726.1 hypothetical protein [Spinactinospora alkalitolerans]
MTHRRGNGLLADAYVPLILLPPALADTMLDALRRAGIAAYAVPLGEDVPALRDAPMEDPPADHLYVDANERRSAEEILRSELPGLEEHTIEVGGQEPAGAAENTEPMAPTDPAARETAPAGGSGDDEVWADLVARFYESGDRDSAWPDAENVSAGRLDDRLDLEDLDATDELDPPGSVAEDREGHPAGAERRAELDDGDHYIPPPPPPLPRGDLTSRLAWGGLFGGPVLLLVSTLLGLPVPDWLAFCAVAGFVAGFVVLVIRMGDRPPRDSGPDDGAVL